VSKEERLQGGGQRQKPEAEESCRRYKTRTPFAQRLHNNVPRPCDHHKHTAQTTISTDCRICCCHLFPQQCRQLKFDLGLLSLVLPSSISYLFASLTLWVSFPPAFAPTTGPSCLQLTETAVRWNRIVCGNTKKPEEPFKVQATLNLRWVEQGPRKAGVQDPGRGRCRRQAGLYLAGRLSAYKNDTTAQIRNPTRLQYHRALHVLRGMESNQAAEGSLTYYCCLYELLCDRH